MNSTVKPIINEDAQNERANDLFLNNFNGLKLVLVSLVPPVNQDETILELHFINELHVADILAHVVSPEIATQTFRIRGGYRVPAGPGSGQIKCIAVSAGPTAGSLYLRVTPIGDYSTYTLELQFDPLRIDPYFSEIPFKFRPGCFTNDCSPELQAGSAPQASPIIDYLAKDYDSFRHTLITAMMERVPGWQVSSEADLDQVLIDLLAASADELSDYQDRVANEAYLSSARKRVSLARHARLMDYHIHQGNQATTELVVMLDTATVPFVLNEELIVWSGHREQQFVEDRIYFASRQTVLPSAQRTWLNPILNQLQLYTWSDSQPALAAGTTSADVVSDVAGSSATIRDLINDGQVKYFVLQELLNPMTGRENGRNPDKRQCLTLLPNAEVIEDSFAGVSVLRIHWRQQDQLRFDYSFTTFCSDGKIEGMSAFFANILMIHHGLPVSTHFYPTPTQLPQDSTLELHRHYRAVTLYHELRAVYCDLPLSPLAYLATPLGGEVPPQSTLQVNVETPGMGSELWDERISLIHSDDSTEEGDHFMVETDEHRQSSLRFGNGVNGRALPVDAIVHCQFQVSGGNTGNIGIGSLNQFQPLSGGLAGAVSEVWNPFDVSNGRDFETEEKIVRNVPQAYQSRQLRAITLADYIRRAEEVPGVANAVATYAWAGSWRTVRLVIDPQGTTELSLQLRTAVAAHLESVRLIGEDLEIRAPRFVPLAIEVALCLQPEVWPGDIRFILEQEFSDVYTANGRLGFFHPDAWSFGATLYVSQIAGRIHAVSGVSHIIHIRMQRYNDLVTTIAENEQLETAFNEIFRVENNPDHMELGFIRFDIRGGRQ